MTQGGRAFAPRLSHHRTNDVTYSSFSNCPKKKKICLFHKTNEDGYNVLLLVAHNNPEALLFLLKKIVTLPKTDQKELFSDKKKSGEKFELPARVTDDLIQYLKTLPIVQQSTIAKQLFANGNPLLIQYKKHFLDDAIEQLSNTA